MRRSTTTRSLTFPISWKGKEFEDEEGIDDDSLRGVRRQVPTACRDRPSANWNVEGRGSNDDDADAADGATASRASRAA